MTPQTKQQPTRLRTAAQLLSRSAGALLDWLYPRHCYACGASLAEESGRILCEHCFGDLCRTRIDGPICVRCGLPLSADQDGLCGGCQSSEPHFDLARSVWPYARPAAEMIRSFKFDGDFFLGPMMIDVLPGMGWLPDVVRRADAVLPIPLHPRRKRERGYDQAHILARALARRIDRPLRSNLLSRDRYTERQTRLTPRQRQKNVRGAFSVRDGADLEDMHLLLVDDVLTTGATAGECARQLKKARARQVTVFSLARTVP